MIVKENGTYVYHRDPGEKRVHNMTDAECIRDINNRHIKASKKSAREILKMIESGRCTPNFPSKEDFEKWKADVLAGKYDKRW